MRAYHYPTLQNESAELNGKTSRTEIREDTTDSLWLTIYQYMKELRTEIVNARVTKLERQELKLIAKHSKKTVSDLLRETINNYKKNYISKGK